ncbi:unnamed protein product [Schistosoma curassoni]|uniref:FHA domain-containing protein n=1 Tax=Schistosoma curassoni TaxID=6186 RepID=A0A183JGZ8_9TREM|nr:unnamed protein product [Schistosoma curassoni]
MDEVCSTQPTDFINNDVISKPMDKLLSREHAIFELDENYICTITDLGSLNGTKRNDLHLKPKINYELRDGDCLYFGGIYCTLNFCLSSSTSSLCLLNPLHEDSKSLELSLQVRFFLNICTIWFKDIIFDRNLNNL